MTFNSVKNSCGGPVDNFAKEFHSYIAVVGRAPDKPKGIESYTKRSVLNRLEFIHMAFRSCRPVDRRVGKRQSVDSRSISKLDWGPLR